MILTSLNSSLPEIKNVGPARKQLLENNGITSIYKLLTFFPRKYEDRLNPVDIQTALRKNSYANTVIKIIKSEFIGKRHKKDLKVYAVETATGTPVSLLLFGRGFMKDRFKDGEEFRLYGKPQLKQIEIIFNTFDTEHAEKQKPVNFNKILPVYRQSKGLTSKYMTKIISSAFNMYGKYIEEDIPDFFIKKNKLLPLHKALYNIHFPKSVNDVREAKRTLKYRELFHLMCSLEQNRLPLKKRTGSLRAATGNTINKVINSLPFTLTMTQQNALEEITQDLCSDQVMYRLLQGDVGCGKTITALLSALTVTDAGQQVVLMAPTELLARQHADSAAKLLEPAGIKTALLTGTINNENRKNLLHSLEQGEINLLVGTHAIFSEKVKYKNLKYVIIDEQQRFGVQQRKAIAECGDNPDILLMSATPIPRTLAHTLYSDLKISEISTLPAGRKPVKTHLALDSNINKVYQHVHSLLNKGNQAYFIYPAIESSKNPAASAVKMHQHLSENIFPDKKCALIHSRIPEQDKEKIMKNFAEGKIDILAATTVLEVGIDNKNATCIVINDAQNFGLSTLHQLRGRVGRSNLQSYAFLVYNKELTETGKSRLLIMKETNDGFKIAEEDLRTRGTGDFSGTRQSGENSLVFADLQKDFKMLKIIKEEVKELLSQDPQLKNDSNSRLLEAVSTMQRETETTY